MGSNNLYTKYLKSEEWKQKSLKCKQLAGNKCSKCGSSKALHAYHLTYIRVGEELQEDLQCLCYKCHGDVHDTRFTIPLMYNIKKITSRINAMDLLTKMELTCKSPKDISILNKLLDRHDEENKIRIDNISNLAKELNISRSKFNELLKRWVDNDLLYKLDRGVYFINPFIFVGRRVRSNSLREKAQASWSAIRLNR